MPDRLHRALSHGAPAAAKAAWVDGFFSDGALLLIHDAELRGLVDDWLTDLHDDDFVDVLPLGPADVRDVHRAGAPFDRRAAGSAAQRCRSGRPARTRRVVRPGVGSAGSGHGRGDPGSTTMTRATRRIDAVALAAGAGGGGPRTARRHASNRPRKSMDETLAALYDARPGEGTSQPGPRIGGLGSSAPQVARWLGDIRSYFPTSVVQVMQRDAIERLGLVVDAARARAAQRRPTRRPPGQHAGRSEQGDAGDHPEHRPRGRGRSGRRRSNDASPSRPGRR